MARGEQDQRVHPADVVAREAARGRLVVLFSDLHEARKVCCECEWNNGGSFKSGALAEDGRAHM
jgi:hypothetical protein